MQIREHIQTAVDWAKRVITQPRSELTDWQRTARFTYDLGWYGWHQLREDRAPQMAAALAFRTLFALLPVIVVTSVVFKGLRGVDKLRELIEQLLHGAGLDEMQVVVGEDGGLDEEEASTVTVGEWASDLIAQIGDINLETLGWVGLAVVIYAAIAMMVTIENAFNIIYRAPEGRSWLRRLPIYWTVLTVGPAAIGLIFYFEGKVTAAMAELGVWAWVFTISGWIWGYAVLWLLLVGLYALVPNTQVAWRPALIGAAVAAIGIMAGKELLSVYVQNAFSFQHLYGTLGLVPVMMIWVYVMWLVLLFGLEVAATLQALGGRRLERMERQRQRTGVVDPASMLVVMQIVAEHFGQGDSVTARRITESSTLPEPTVLRMIERLVEAKLIHRVSDGAVTLARPPEEIRGDQIVELGYELLDESERGRKYNVVNRLRESQRELAADFTLASLLRADAEAPTNQAVS